MQAGHMGWESCEERDQLQRRNKEKFQRKWRLTPNAADPPVAMGEGGVLS